VRLRELAGAPEGDTYTAAISTLFDLLGARAGFKPARAASKIRCRGRFETGPCKE
jgi:hypothetical protein